MITSKPPSGIARQLRYGPKCPNGTEHIDQLARSTRSTSLQTAGLTLTAGRFGRPAVGRSRRARSYQLSYATPGRGPRPSAEPVISRRPLHSTLQVPVRVRRRESTTSQELLMRARVCRPSGRCQSKDISISGSRDLASHDYMRDKAEVLHTQSLRRFVSTV
jgi:hypothetical protein